MDKPPKSDGEDIEQGKDTENILLWVLNGDGSQMKS